MKPSGLQYFENFNERCLAELETAHDAGSSVAGIYCIFAPAELIRAAGAIPVGLCGKKQAPNPLTDAGPMVKTAIKVFNTIGLSILVILSGLVVYFRRSARKRKIQAMFA